LKYKIQTLGLYRPKNQEIYFFMTSHDLVDFIDKHDLVFARKDQITHKFIFGIRESLGLFLRYSRF
jgi:hypothetical protein